MNPIHSFTFGATRVLMVLATHLSKSLPTCTVRLGSADSHAWRQGMGSTCLFHRGALNCKTLNGLWNGVVSDSSVLYIMFVWNGALTSRFANIYSGISLLIMRRAAPRFCQWLYRNLACAAFIRCQRSFEFEFYACENETHRTSHAYVQR